MASDPRERLLDATEELIYQEGIHATGIDTILERARVAKGTLYKQFGSKDSLVVATLERRDRDWMDRLREAVDARTEDPAEKPLALFDAMASLCGGEGFHGCIFINAAGEYSDESHPVRRVAAQHKRVMRDYIGDLCRGAGVSDPDELADQIFLLAEGTIVSALVSGNEAAPAEARGAAEILMSAQRSVTPPRTYKGGGGRRSRKP